VRELENVVERAVLLAEGTAITPAAIPISVTDPASEWSGVPDDAKALVEAKKELRAEAVDRLERLFVLKALQAADWNVTHAAQNVGMQRTNFHALMRKHKVGGTPDSEVAEDVSATV
jgi:two-component system NtrC family response regulator